MKEQTYITVCLFMIVIGTFLLCHNFLMIQKLEVYNQMNLKLYALEEKDKEKIEGVDVEVAAEDVVSEEESYLPQGPGREYIGTLAIPRIRLRLGLVSPDSRYNNIDSNITIISPSSMPDVAKGNLIIAGHSGTGYLAFFKNLYKLEVGDTASVTYQQQQYNYRLVNIYYEEKLGYVTIQRDTSKKTLTLITCTKDNDRMQTIYIFEEII